MKKCVGLLAVVALAGSAMGQNTGAHLVAGDAFFDLTTGGTGALPTAPQAANPNMNFQITAAPALRNIFTGYWYYRVSGDTRERNPANATSRTLTGASRADWTFPVISGTTALAGVSSGMMFEVWDTGVDSAALNSTFTVNNGGASALSIDIFCAYDIDLGGNNANGFAGDAYAALDTSGGNRQWNISDTGATNGGAPWSAFFQGRGAHGAGAGGFTPINGQMTDTNVDNFIPDLNAGGLAAADSAAVMQWRVTINPGASFTAESWLAIAKNGASPTIPTPGSAALLGLAGLFAGRRRR